MRKSRKGIKEICNQSTSLDNQQVKGEGLQLIMRDADQAAWRDIKVVESDQEDDKNFRWKPRRLSNQTQARDEEADLRVQTIGMGGKERRWFHIRNCSPFLVNRACPSLKFTRHPTVSPGPNLGP